MSDGAHSKPALARAAEAWVVTLTSGDATGADADALALWRARSPEHEAAFRQAARMWKGLGETGAAGLGRAPPARPAGLDRRWFLGGGLAAAGAGALVLQHPPLDLWPSLAELGADHRTAPGKQQDVALSPGLTVHLNTRTALSGGRGDHLKLLSGEALFVAAAGTSVRIDAGAARMQAAASQINVRYDAQRGEVTCLDGRVEIACREGRATLVPGQKVRFTEHGLGDVRAADPRRTVAWREGLLIFSGDRLDQVVQEINRYRTTPVILRDRGLASLPISGVFHLNALDAAVTHLSRILGRRLTELPGGFLLLG